jgi:hypothetical protein
MGSARLLGSETCQIAPPSLASMLRMRCAPLSCVAPKPNSPGCTSKLRGVGDCGLFGRSRRSLEEPKHFSRDLVGAE